MMFKIASARHLKLGLAALALALAWAAPARAQEEGVPVVLDEPIVQVNNDVIMLSHLKRETEGFREVLIKQRGMTERQAERILTLPVNQYMAPADVETVAHEVLAFLDR